MTPTEKKIKEIDERIAYNQKVINGYESDNKLLRFERSKLTGIEVVYNEEESE